MNIPGVIISPLKSHHDQRGWLLELFRNDELPGQFQPEMSYISMTLPGITRGPHEHKEQTDAFAFISGNFQLHLWENRTDEPDNYTVLDVGENNPCLVIVPPGVVHAYKNVGDKEAFVLNFPNKLYKGYLKNDEVDEIRHEDDLSTRFKL